MTFLPSCVACVTVIPTGRPPALLALITAAKSPDGIPMGVIGCQRQRCKNKESTVDRVGIRVSIIGTWRVFRASSVAWASVEHVEYVDIYVARYPYTCPVRRSERRLGG